VRPCRSPGSRSVVTLAFIRLRATLREILGRVASLSIVSHSSARRSVATSRRVLISVAAAVALVAAFAAVTARLFVWPDLRPLPARADAIVELGGTRALDRDRVALALARAQKAPVLLQSTLAGDTKCLPPIPGVRIECFHPEPWTTRGEARYIAGIAAERHWNSIILVTTPDQAWRADLRFSRCFPGNIYNATAALHWHEWFRQIPYQWTASIKAVTTERAC
jgi:uncharacterized SAM-binding protein YcdF (DUF218 family)